MMKTRKHYTLEIDKTLNRNNITDKQIYAMQVEIENLKNLIRMMQNIIETDSKIYLN